jgi:SAM-dependent methyltransferase
MADWKRDWPLELHGVLDQVAAKFGVESLYFEGEFSGLGGARTFRARTDVSNGRGHRVVLKIGNGDLIRDEQKRFKEAMIHFGKHPALQDFADKDAFPSWLVMSVALDGLGQTLRDMFDELSADEVYTVIDQLFNRAIRIYEKTGFNRSRSAFGQYNLRPDLIPNLRAIGDEPYTLVDWWKHAASRDEQRSTEAFIHGDLHGGNILLAGQKDSIEVSLIDFGLSGIGHAYRDLAKLERDICLFVGSVHDDSVSARLLAIERQLGEERSTGDPNFDSGDQNIARAVLAIQRIRGLAKGFARAVDGELWRHEYEVALTAQFIFSAGNRKVSEAKRRAALARAHSLRVRLISSAPALRPEAAEVRERQLEDQAWKIAYCLLRLDQLPRGGWSRSLPQWMELLWEGEHGTVFRSPSMKDDGGADSAGHAVQLLSNFAGRVYCEGLGPNDGIGQALQKCAMAFQKRIGPHGGLDEGVTSRGDPPPIKVRHTLVGLLVHLNCRRLGVPAFEADVYDHMVDYLLEVLPRWREDKSHLFGMYASAVALWRVLGQLPADALLSKFAILIKGLEAQLPNMAWRLQDVMYEPMPEKTYSGSLVHNQVSASFFIPYYGWWRMERSNALMFLPLLLDESGSRFAREHELPHEVKRRIGASLAHLLEEITDSKDLSEGLIRYHESVGGTQASRDWGLSAELARLLDMPLIQALIKDTGVQEAALLRKISVLRRALRETLVDYRKYHDVFRFIHGLSAGAYLGEHVVPRISQTQVTVLDDQIMNAVNKFCSEKTLHRLAQCILTGRRVTMREDQAGESTDEAKMLTELFVRTLASGDHISKEHWNETSYERTIAYFDRPDVMSNPAALDGDSIHDTLFLRLEHVSGRFKENRICAADLGCGYGLASKWLADRCIQLTLVDGSTGMLERAKVVLKGIPPSEVDFKYVCDDVRGMNRYLTNDSFDLVIANAVFVHVAPMHAADLIVKIYNILKPGGHFFFNLKIRDHSLVGLDGRYFAYYPDITSPRSMLRVAGFEIDEIALRENHRTCYGVPKNINWANFYCRRPEKSGVSGTNSAREP